MNYYDGYDKGCFPCGESYFDRQQFCFNEQPVSCDKKSSNIKCCFDKKFLMECEIKCKPYRPKPQKPCFIPVCGCLCVKPPYKKGCW